MNRIALLTMLLAAMLSAQTGKPTKEKNMEKYLEVATLVNDLKEVGYHYADWNAAGLPSGMYFYRITVGDFAETKKMTLMK